jgi:hypothetical protein
MAITLRVAWQSPYDNKVSWNELLAWTIEQFGMPNHEQYAWHAEATNMEFIFQDEHDALMFQLYCGHSERVNTNQYDNGVC